MKNSIFFPASVLLILLAFSSCRNGSSVKQPVSDSRTGIAPEGLLQVGSNMITDVILRPDTLGDPWEVEKVKGFDANIMFNTLLANIYNNKITVYSVITGETMKPAEVKKIVDEFNSDLKRIAKLQFCDDWFLDPSTGNIERKTRSIILGYVIQREEGLPPSYKAMFRIKP
jgi:hypothetical protein